MLTVFNSPAPRHLPLFPLLHRSFLPPAPVPRLQRLPAPSPLSGRISPLLDFLGYTNVDAPPIPTRDYVLPLPGLLALLLLVLFPGAGIAAAAAAAAAAAGFAAGSVAGSAVACFFCWLFSLFGCCFCCWFFCCC